MFSKLTRKPAYLGQLFVMIGLARKLAHLPQIWQNVDETEVTASEPAANQIT